MDFNQKAVLQKSLNNMDVKHIAEEAYALFRQAPSKTDAIHSTSKYLISTLGSYISPDILTEPDEISLHFIELLDQILFEINENSNKNTSIHEYIINDLYNRTISLIEVFHDIELYRRNLLKRNLQYEDTIIIKNLHLNEFIDKLIVAFDENPDLQKYILIALNSLDISHSDRVLNFYYRVYKESTSDDIRIQSLIGLKRIENLFKNWKGLKQNTPELSALIDFAKSFSWYKTDKPSIPSDINILYFIFHYIEATCIKKCRQADLNRLINTLKYLIYIHETDSILSMDIFRSVTNIILNTNNNELNIILDNASNLTNFISILDKIPLDYFNRIKAKVSLVIDNYTSHIKNLFSSGTFAIAPEQSNTMNYLFLSSGNML